MATKLKLIKCSCDWSTQAGCKYSKGNGIPNSKDKTKMSDCMKVGDCSFQK